MYGSVEKETFRVHKKNLCKPRWRSSSTRGTRPKINPVDLLNRSVVIARLMLNWHDAVCRLRLASRIEHCRTAPFVSPSLPAAEYDREGETEGAVLHGQSDRLAALWYSRGCTPAQRLLDRSFTDLEYFHFKPLYTGRSNRLSSSTIPTRAPSL